MRNNHEIDFEIKGEEMQLVEIELDPQETAIAEAGAFMYFWRWFRANGFHGQVV